MFLINTPYYEDLETRLRQASHLLSATVQDSFDMATLFSISIAPQEAPVLYHAYIKAKRNIIFASADKEGYIVFSDKNEHIPSVDEGTLHRLIQPVWDRDSTQLRPALEHFAQSYSATDQDMVQVRKLTSICALTMALRLMEMGVDRAEQAIYTCLKRIAAAQTAQESQEALFAYMLALINAEQKISDKSARYVYDAIAFIKKNYGRDITVPDIAKSSTVNPIYLNKLFKLSTGKTVSEYLNIYRTEKAQILLRETDDAIGSISGQVGYHDTRSFIRFFKKFYGMTPSDYRNADKGN